MMAGVCIEYCVEIGRLDLLFGDVFSSFVAVNEARAFLDLLEPYILREVIRYLPPEVMAALIEHYQEKGALPCVERCLLHMEVKGLDFNSAVTILRKHKLYSALVHVYTIGLGDFSAPLELMLEGAMEAQRSGQRKGELETVGYKALLYLTYCLTGKRFPSGEPTKLSPAVLKEMTALLLAEALSPGSRKRLKIDADDAFHGTYPYLRVLLKLDCPATLEVLSLVLDGKLVVDSSRVLVQALSSLFMASCASGDGDFQDWPEESMAEFKEVVARHMARGNLRQLPPPLTKEVLEHLATGRAGIKDAQGLLETLLGPHQPWGLEPALVAGLVPKVTEAGYSRAALALHRHALRNSPPEARAASFEAAIQCFLVDSEPSFQRRVFDFASSEVEQWSLRAHESAQHAETLAGMKAAVLSRVAVLVEVDRVEAAKLIAAEVLEGDHKRLLATLQDSPRQLYGLLSALVLGQAEEGPPQNLHLDRDDLRHLVSLMARFEPGNVYKYLSTHSDYPVEDCILVCREHNITDAEAYLLERKGDIGAALDLILRTIDKCFETLKGKLRSMSQGDLVRQGVLLRPTASRVGELSVNGKVALAVLGEEMARSVRVAIEVCERSSIEAQGEAQGDHGLWNYMLDRLLVTKRLLKLGSEALDRRIVLEAMLTEIMQIAWNKMSAYVPLAVICRKIMVRRFRLTCQRWLGERLITLFN